MSRTATAADLVPEAHRVLGTLLRPFSLGHHLLLKRLGSPYTSHAEAEGSPAELALAVFCCAVPFSVSLETILSGEWDAAFAAWSRRLRAPWWRRTRFQHATEAAAWRAYLTDGYRAAPIWRHGGGLQLTAPWECLMLARLGANGQHQADILELYLPAAWYAYHTLAELQRADNWTGRGQWLPTFYTARHEAQLHPAPSPPADEP